MDQTTYSVAVVGATGLVGAEIVRVLGEREFPVGNLCLYASERSAGERMAVGRHETIVELLDRADFCGVDIAFFASTETATAGWAGRAAQAGAVVIDLSQLNADDPTVPLVVPEVNAAAIGEYGSRRIIASPHALAIQLAVVLKPLRDVAGLKRVVVSSYCPVSMAGRPGIETLSNQTIEILNGRSPELNVFPHRIAFGLLPQVGEFLAGGHTRSELQLVVQTQRLLSDADLPISTTNVLVPIFYGSSQAVNIETKEPLDAVGAREVLRGAPGVLLQDDPTAAEYPTPDTAVGTDATCVGRIRDDESLANGLNLWISSDNLGKGAAVNAVGIAELLIRDYSPAKGPRGSGAGERSVSDA